MAAYVHWLEVGVRQFDDAIHGSEHQQFPQKPVSRLWHLTLTA
jgi:hypothetical protein